MLYVVLVERGVGTGESRAFVPIGLLGALTTFSTYALDAVMLMERGALLRAGAHIVGNVVLCIGIAWLGAALLRRLM